jgi:hypothetical protein
MRSNWKRIMRGAAGAASVLNGVWALQLQNGNAHVEWAPVAAAVLSVWACYFSILWILQGMRSDP